MTQQLDSSPVPIERQEAFSKGLTRYFTGRPCINGHTVQRYVTTGGCISCTRDAQRSFARGKNGAYIWVKVRVHKTDAEAIRHTATMLNALRDAKLAAAVTPAAHGKTPKEPAPSKPHGRISD